MQAGFFDQEDRLSNFEKLGDLSLHLDSNVDWQAFRPLSMVIHQKQRKSNAGHKSRDVPLMFKMRVLQSLYNPPHDTNRPKANALAAPECGIGTD